MSENSQSDLTPQVPSGERAGDLLRKERINRRITIETIAKDLRLNVNYIKSLEASEYESLPADPYVRVYLRSLAKYLTLDPEEILKKFYMERGIALSNLGSDSSSKIHVSMKDKEERSSPMLIVAIVLIVLLAGFSFFANKKGWISAPGFLSSSDSTSTVATPDTVSDSLLDDSLFSGAPVQPSDSQAVDTVATVDTVGMMHLVIQVTGDSVWLQVFSDGNSWKNVIYNNDIREFIARDSINVQVANNTKLQYSLNGKPLQIKGNGFTTFKLNKSGKQIPWSTTRWNTVFKNRL
ncbi:MAG: hypothetical protein GX556_09000 [Fibrobacter sp.]|nr:hypothetical protein [Fibrobacter sp.]